LASASLVIISSIIASSSSVGSRWFPSILLLELIFSDFELTDGIFLAHEDRDIGAKPLHGVKGKKRATPAANFIVRGVQLIFM
jgi:hypothetical protein